MVRPRFHEENDRQLVCALDALAGKRNEERQGFRESRTCSSSSRSKPVHDIKVISRIDTNLFFASDLVSKLHGLRSCEPSTVYLLRPRNPVFLCRNDDSNLRHVCPDSKTANSQATERFIRCVATRDRRHVDNRHKDDVDLRSLLSDSRWKNETRLARGFYDPIVVVRYDSSLE